MRRVSRSGSEEPVSLESVVRAVAEKLTDSPADAFADLAGAWPGVAGRLLAGHTKPVSLLDGVLTIAVDDPAFAPQVRYLESELLAGLERAVPSAAPRALKALVRPPE